MSTARIEIVEGDITRLEVDAIVNAANDRLLPGGGVCGAIHRAAGPGLEEACLALGQCPAGEARITSGFRLPARYVIHAVGPVWRGGLEDEAGLLAGAYRSALQLAEQHRLDSIAFPAISTGIYGYPLEEATKVALRAVREWIAEHKRPRRVLFCAFGPDVLRAYRAALT